MLFHLGNKPTGDQFSKETLGGKGHGLFDMVELGVPVPEFAVIPTDLCVEYMAKPAETKMKVKGLVSDIIKLFANGEGYVPLLSVRSGARVSMPGMMDTILNVGAGTSHCAVYSSMMADRQFADCNRRFLHMYGSTVLGIDDQKFEAEMDRARKMASVETDAELNALELNEVVGWFKTIYTEAKHEIPATLEDQLFNCIIAVMESWNSERAKEYREHNGISHDWGTAVVIQRMVFGNMNDESGSGVLFSRCPITGEDGVVGEFLPNAQGEDVVAGIRTPLSLAKMTGMWPKVGKQLLKTVSELEQTYKDMLDIEFTVEDGELYFLQVRVAKRSARAWVRSTLDMYEADWIDSKQVAERIKRSHVKLLTQPVVDAAFDKAPSITGLPACSGVAVGFAAFTKEQALQYKAQGEDCILIRHETSPEDIAGMFAAVGILTATGGSTSHAAVVARGMDKVCVTGATGLQITGNQAEVSGPKGTFTVQQGSKVVVDGTTGRVWFDTDVPVSDPSSDKDLADLIAYVDGGTTYLDAALPGSQGVLYSLVQFLGDVPPPTADEVHVVVNQTQLSDPLLGVTGQPDISYITERMVQWANQHGVKVILYTEGEHGTVNNVTVKATGTGLDGLLDRPVTADEIEAFFGGSLAAVEKLIAPAKLADKFKLAGCGRYRLMSAFG